MRKYDRSTQVVAKKGFQLWFASVPISLCWYKRIDFEREEKKKEFEGLNGRESELLIEGMSVDGSLLHFCLDSIHMSIVSQASLGFLDLTSPVMFLENCLRRKGSDREMFLLKKADDFLRKPLSS